jgi:transketolase
MGIPNRRVLSQALLNAARNRKDVIAMASDSAGSATLTEFAQELPEQFIELGIAEQNLVGVAAGLAKTGLNPFVCSPACFLAARSIEQVKVDVAYSEAPVRLIGISGGVSYGALGSTHHSLQDLAVMRAIPGITIVVPSDNVSTQRLFAQIMDYPGPVYMRLGRGPVEGFHSEDYQPTIGKGDLLSVGKDLTIIVTGEPTVNVTKVVPLLQAEGVDPEVIELHTIKPIDTELILDSAKKTGCVVTVEEHSIYGGLGSAVAELLVQNHPVPMKILGIPDEPVVTGSQAEVFAHYGLDPVGMAKSIRAFLENRSR